MAGNPRDEWFIDKVNGSIDLTIRQRIVLATEWLRNKTVLNISKPVVKEVRPRTGGGQHTVVTERSKPGEYPRADTTLLRKSIFGIVEETEPHIFDGYVGTPVEYSVRLELQLDRSFLLRSIKEEKNNLIKLLTDGN